MVFEYYIDANFLVDLFLPDDLITKEEKRWKENAWKFYDELLNKPDAKLMISCESMLEAVGVIGKRLLENAGNEKLINIISLSIRMAHIASEITRWEQEGRYAEKIRIKSPKSVDGKVYQKALELCRKYSVMPLSRYYGRCKGQTVFKGIGGIDAFHLAYSIDREGSGSIRSILVTRDKALSEAAKKEGRSARIP